jgi:hypothetical protein
LDSNFFRHFILKSDKNNQVFDCFAFSTKQLYETWGDAKGFKTSQSNRLEDRLVFVADSAGLTNGTNIPTWYSNYADNLMNTEFQSQLLCFLSARLSVDMCNPSANVGDPNACSGNNFVMFYPAPCNVATMTLMNDKASAWLTKRTPYCTSDFYAHFRAYKKWFYRRRIGTITVNINYAESQPELFVPFKNDLSEYNDEVSSFIQWGTPFN